MIYVLSANVSYRVIFTRIHLVTRHFAVYIYRLSIYTLNVTSKLVVIVVNAMIHSAYHMLIIYFLLMTFRLAASLLWQLVEWP